ncbi:hypothetical protein V2P20_07675 [Methylobacter sp. Wu1]|uniref:DUF6933 domain-containing protein n=1 Tax=Methylobacter sp. Wu1 TaxID=3119359 RepID=UPI002F9363EF
MITIHATKKLYAHLPVAATMNPPPSDDSAATPPDSADNPLSGWHANLLTLQRRLCVVLVHDATRFPLFMKGLVKADFANFDRLFADTLMNTLLKLGANQTQMDSASALLAPCRFDTDCNRSVQGTMNQMAGDIEHMLRFDHTKLDDICSYRTGVWLADRPCTLKGQKDCIWPEKAMLALLTEAGRGVDSANVKNNIVHLGSRDG